jgi:hypothetical protein
MIDVVSVKPMGGFRLWIAFSDGTAGVHNFSSTAARDGEMVRPLKDPAFFARVFTELGALTWPNGFDLDPIALHDRMSAAGELSSEAPVPRLPTRERDRLLAEAREHSRSIRDDPREQALLDELESIQADNAQGFEHRAWLFDHGGKVVHAFVAVVEADAQTKPPSRSSRVTLVSIETCDPFR